MSHESPTEIADQICEAIKLLPSRSVPAIRTVRREFSARLKDRSAEDIYQIALALLDRRRWVGYELLYYHPSHLQGLDDAKVEKLGEGMTTWDDVDTFGRYVSGIAWNKGLIRDETISRWTESPEMVWRRSALVSTVCLNLEAAGGKGDTRRTLTICERLVDDREDLVVKALSWALRALANRDKEAVHAFMAKHESSLAARVKREVSTMLRTGTKNKSKRLLGE